MITRGCGELARPYIGPCLEQMTVYHWLTFGIMAVLVLTLLALFTIQVYSWWEWRRRINQLKKGSNHARGLR